MNAVYLFFIILLSVMICLLIVGLMTESLDYEDLIHLFIGIIAIFLFLFASAKVKKDENEPIPVECQEIKSFALHSETSTSASGAFYLGCGYVTSSGSTELKYYFYKKGQVGYVLCSISASRVELVETDEKPPGIEGIFTDSGDIKLFENYVIYVPTGTIFEEYKVEL